jgi:hypothetical protein
MSSHRRARAGWAVGAGPSGGGGLRDYAAGVAVPRATETEEGGEVNASTPVIEEAQANVGATVMGRNMFGGGPGPWRQDPSWNGWWATKPSLPHVGLCADPPSPRAAGDGGRHPFFFVVDGIESALEQAKQAAGDRDVLLGGVPAWSCSTWPPGWSTSSCHSSRSCSDGERLLENVGDLQVQQVRAVEAPGVTHIKYRVVKDR